MEQNRGYIARHDLGLPNIFVRPTSPTEKSVADIWRKELNLDAVGLDDDFFNLGGDSLSAANIAVAISDEFKRKFEPAMLFERPTIRDILDWNDGAQHEGATLPNCLLALKSSGSLPPVFLIHGRSGLLFPKPNFMAGFDPAQPVYAFQAPGYDGSMEPLEEIEAIAEEYLRAMLLVQPSGPWFIGAFCNGSWIAVEMVRLMESQGLNAQSVTLLDPGALNGEMREAYKANKGLVSGLGLPVVSPVAAQLKRSYFWFSRRLNCLWHTGRWKDFKSRDAYASPPVAKWITQRRADQAKKLSRRVLREDAENKYPELRNSQDLHSVCENFSSASAAFALAKMQTAFWNHNPKEPSDFEYDLVVSASRHNELRDPDHPINLIMKNARVIQSGETHIETVGAYSAQNSKFIQEKVFKFGTTENDLES